MGVVRVRRSAVMEASKYFSDSDLEYGRKILDRLADYKKEAAGIPTPAVNDPDKRDEISLGVIRLDYDYPPAPGDIDHPSSFGYKVHYKIVPGLTFAMAQDGVLTPEVKSEFVAAIRFLDGVKHVHAITGDCGFMFWFQRLAREHTKKPVFLSSLVALPSVTATFAQHEQVMIMTANGKTLEPMHEMIAEFCGVDIMCQRYVLVGCESVPGFEAVERGEKVDTELVQPGIVDLAKRVISEHPGIRAILLECTELPPYADALRFETGLPVYDAITTSDGFICGFLDNPRFGLDSWMHAFNGQGQQQKYKLGVELTTDNKVSCKTCGTNLVACTTESIEKAPAWYQPHKYVTQKVKEYIKPKHKNSHAH